jgi:TonB family protein
METQTNRSVLDGRFSLKRRSLVINSCCQEFYDMTKEIAGTLGRVVARSALAALFSLTAWAGVAQAQIFTEQDALAGRLNRARALAAANNLPAAAKELEAIRASTKDDATRDATAIMLMSLYFEQANYEGAQALLEESFAARAKNAGSYFATAGQSLRGVRVRLERYRLYSLNVSAPDLPDEAVADLDRVRGLLERMAEQTKMVSKETPQSFEASALLEDVATLRASLARDERDRARWAGELAAVRGRMVESETRMNASNNVVLTSAPTPANTNVAANTPSGNTPARGAGRAVTKPGAPPAPAPSKPTETAKNNTPEPQPAVVPQPATPARVAGNSFDAGGATAASLANNQPPKTTAAPPAPASARVAGQPVEVGQLALKATQKRTPTYPIIAKNARVTGTVKVYLEVDEKGGIARVKNVEGPVLLQRAAEDAARAWKFNQTIIDGQAVRVSGFLVFNFVL